MQCVCRACKAADLKGQAVQLTMSHAQSEEIGDGDEKPVLYFQGHQRGLALNKTNAMVIADSYGPETESWAGQAIEVYPDKTTFGGKIVDCLRVRVPVPQADADADVPF